MLSPSFSPLLQASIGSAVTNAAFWRAISLQRADRARRGVRTVLPDDVDSISRSFNSIVCSCARTDTDVAETGTVRFVRAPALAHGCNGLALRLAGRTPPSDPHCRDSSWPHCGVAPAP